MFYYVREVIKVFGMKKGSIFFFGIFGVVDLIVIFFKFFDCFVSSELMDCFFGFSKNSYRNFKFEWVIGIGVVKDY